MKINTNCSKAIKKQIFNAFCCQPAIIKVTAAIKETVGDAPQIDPSCSKLAICRAKFTCNLLHIQFLFKYCNKYENKY